MFLTDPSHGEPLICSGCGGIITGSVVRIDYAELAGDYCGPCAKPLLSVLRALEMLAGPFGR
jgi:hypothetical protein